MMWALSKRPNGKKINIYNKETSHIIVDGAKTKKEYEE